MSVSRGPAPAGPLRVRTALDRLEVLVPSSAPMATQYQPLVRLGKGGMAELWLGVLEGALGYRKPVVFKRATTHDPEDDLEEATRALVEEARVASLLQHGNVVHVYALIDPPEGLMLVMEYLDGFSLRRLFAHALEQGFTLPPPVALRLVADAARGLSAAHALCDAQGKNLCVVHGDVSPENLVVTADGVTKVVDFGVARSRLRRARGEGEVRVTVRYASPEQVRGGNVDARSDVFALGAVLFEALEGAPLLRGADREAIAQALLAGPFPEPTRPIGDTVRALLRTMLTREVAARTASMGEVAAVLEAEAASHDAVRRFLAEELGTELAARRTEVAALLARPGVDLPLVTSEHTASGFALDALIEASRAHTWTRAEGDDFPDDEPTLVDVPPALDRDGPPRA